MREIARHMFGLYWTIHHFLLLNQKCEGGSEQLLELKEGKTEMTDDEPGDD
jgi:hypothetical protein